MHAAQRTSLKCALFFLFYDFNKEKNKKNDGWKDDANFQFGLCAGVASFIICLGCVGKPIYVHMWM